MFIPNSLRREARWIAIIVCLFFPDYSALAASAAEEYEIKAAFLYRLFNFINWPAEVFPSPDSPFQLCILGEDPFGDNFDIIIKEGEIAGRKVNISRFKGAESSELALSCHVLFICDDLEQTNREAFLAQLKEKPILTVSDIQDFAEEGGMIEFIKTENRVRLAINRQSVLKGGLKINPHLLKISQIVGSGDAQ